MGARAGHLVQLRLDGGQPLGVGGGVDVVDPHDDGVLARLGVVVLPHPHGGEAEAAVEGLGRIVAHPDLEGQVADPERGGGPGRVGEQDGADAPMVPVRVHRQGGDVAVVVHHHEPDVAHHDGADGRHRVAPGGPLGQLGQEEGGRPGPGVGLLLDRGPPTGGGGDGTGPRRTAPATPRPGPPFSGPGSPPASVIVPTRPRPGGPPVGPS